MISHKNLFLLVFILGFLHSIHAKITVYDDSKGLSNSNVLSIVKDRTGLIWVGTESGLNTYDGYVFSEVHSFKGIRINTLTYDSLNHEIWVGTDVGLFWMDIQTLQVVDCTAKVKSKQVVDIVLYQNSAYTVFLNGNVMQIDREWHCKVVFGLYRLPVTDKVIKRSIAANGQGSLFLITGSGECMIEIHLGSLLFKSAPNTHVKEIESVIAGSDYVLLSYDTNEYAVWNYDRSHWIKPLRKVICQKPIRVVHSKDHYHFACNKKTYGLLQYDELNAKWEQVVPTETKELKSKNINTAFKDEQGVLWVGTNKGLLKYCNEASYPVKWALQNPSSPISVRQIVKGANHLFYVATYDGVYEYNEKTNETKLIQDAGKDPNFPVYTRALYIDPKHQYLYGGTESNRDYFYRYNISTKTFESGFFKQKDTSVKISSVYGFYANPNGILWLATDKGLASYNTRTNELKQHIQDKFSIGSNRLYMISKATQKNQFWAAGREGFYLVDEVLGVLKKWTPQSQPAAMFDDYYFVSEDQKGKVWLGTKKSGLVIFDIPLNSIQVLTKSSGLPSNEVYSILWQNDSIGWITTANGLTRYNRIQQEFQTLYSENGLSDREFNQNAFYNDKGLFYLGGINGVNIVKPDEIVVNSRPVAIFGSPVSSLQSYNKLPVNNEIVIKANNPQLMFGFGLSDYTETESNTFYYRIKGLHSEWITLGNQNQLRIEGLPAGNYTVEIIGFNKQGSRSSNALTFKVFVQQVFYKTWWFYVLIALGVVTIIYVNFRGRLRSIHQRQQLRTKIASDLHDEVGSLLTSIIISTDNARYSANTLELKDEKLEKISNLSRAATHTMSDVLWSIDARNDFAGNLTDRIREHAESMLHPLDIEVQFDFTATQQQQNIEPETRQQLYLILKEAIHNIAKHTHATVVKVYYKQQGSKFELRIENNNHSEQFDQMQHVGQGLKNMKMRAANIKAKCTFEVLGNNYCVVVKSSA